MVGNGEPLWPGVVEEVFLGRDVNALGRNSLEEICKEGVVDEIAIFFKRFTYCQ
jgi:hypothetical protein